MSGFLSWFFEFISKMLEGIVTIFSGIINGIITIFNIPAYGDIFKKYTANFETLDWIFSILAVVVVISIWVLVGYLIFLLIRRRIRLGKLVASQEDMFEQIADLHKEVLRLTEEKDRILALKIAESGVSEKALAEAIIEITEKRKPEAFALDGEQLTEKTDIIPGVIVEPRFQRLAEVDEKYVYYIHPDYVVDVTLQDICENLRNFACSRMNLYYSIKTIRCMIAGMASTKMILLQGISGTGKTSLPYCMGKFFTHDSTIASVQPSWRDRTELFGYFNEFTKRFNETEVLKRIYEASYNDDLNLIILDEMNIARVEYYFADMLSILEMPDRATWNLELVPSSWQNDPVNLKDGKLSIPENVWYIGTANNDDSTFSVSDKVYDRALVINLDSKGDPFDAPDTPPMNISFTYLEKLCNQATRDFPLSKENYDKISKLDIFIIQKLRIAFGNRILKQLKIFVPTYVACGGTELEAIDYILATKIFRKFESLNLSLVRDELKELTQYLTKTFGKNSMPECKSYIEYLQRLF